MVEGQLIPIISHHHQPPKAEAELLFQLNSPVASEKCVKSAQSSTVPQRVRRKNYDKLLNSWVDVMTTHDLMRTETTQMSKKT